MEGVDFDPAHPYDPVNLKWFLDQGVDPKIRVPKNGNTHLFAYISKEPISQWRESMSLLLEHKADIHEYGDFGRTSPLLFACVYGTEDQVKFLLDNKADPNQSANTATYPLLWSAQFSTPQIVQWLLDAGANINTKSKSGVTALMFACSNRAHFRELIPMLVMVGADLRARDDQKRDALHWASEWSSDVFALMKEYYTILTPLKTWWIKGSCADPLRVLKDAMACGYISMRSTEITLHHTAKHVLWWRTRLGWPVSSLAEKMWNLPTMHEWRTVVINLGECRINNSEQSSFLHLAAGRGDTTAVEWIIKSKRISPYLLDRDGQRPIDVAKNPAIWTMLRDYMEFQFMPLHMAWHGPYFYDKLFTFLLVLKRNAVAMPKDLILIIFRPIAFFQEY